MFLTCKQKAPFPVDSNVPGINYKNGLKVLMEIIMMVPARRRECSYAGSRPLGAGAAGDPVTSSHLSHPGHLGQASHR